ncbi:hypothetical protein [Amycolatopsis sp. NPDC059657]|uniref:hypothetical protein n=1 Tax=Amycolatopsis sp. NPDC059657 TaxID=3346899 RepID=UPI00366EAD40
MKHHVAKVNGKTKNPRWPVDPVMLELWHVPRRWMVGLALDDFDPAEARLSDAREAGNGLARSTNQGVS